MTIENVDLYSYFGFPKPQGAAGILTAYAHYQAPEHCADRKRPAILVIPGGAYAFVSDREKEPIALKYVNAGFNAFTLTYSIKPLSFPTQLIEGAMAMAYIRENADKYNLLPDKVAAIGFSAGGHLLGMISTMFNCPEITAALKDKASLVKPDAAIFSYAVITSGEKTHAGSMLNLCRGDSELISRVSIENNVTAFAPPAFIWATATDTSVPCENSLLLASAYKKAGVPFELHLFANGCHGLALCDEETASPTSKSYLIEKSVKPWLDLSVTWLYAQGFRIKL